MDGEKSNDFVQFIDGIELVNQQLGEVLGEMGIQPIPAVGEHTEAILRSLGRDAGAIDALRAAGAI